MTMIQITLSPLYSFYWRGYTVTINEKKQWATLSDKEGGHQEIPYQFALKLQDAIHEGF
jgi:hypothetical protein